MYCNETRDIILAKNRAAVATGNFDIEQALALGFRNLTDDQRSKYEQDFADYKKAREGRAPQVLTAESQLREAAPSAERSRSTERKRTWAVEKPDADEDVEMNDGTEEHTAGDASGFTAVNRA